MSSDKEFTEEKHGAGGRGNIHESLSPSLDRTKPFQYDWMPVYGEVNHKSAGTMATADRHSEFVDHVYQGPHRCNSRMDDFLKGVLQFPPRPRGTFRHLVRCTWAGNGFEPDDPWLYLGPDYFEETANRTMKSWASLKLKNKKDYELRQDKAAASAARIAKRKEELAQ